MENEPVRKNTDTLMSDEGKEITLYRLHRGDLCMLSACCVLSAVTFDVFVDAEEDSRRCGQRACFCGSIAAESGHPHICVGNCGQLFFRCDVGDAAGFVYE